MHHFGKGILSAVAIASTVGVAQAADMPLDWYPQADPPRVRRVWPPEPAQPVYRSAPPERPIKKGDRLPLSSAPEHGGDAGVTVRSRDACPLVTAPTSGAPSAPSAKGAAPEDRSYLIPLLLVILAMIGLLAIIGSLPRLVRGIDRLFEPSTGEIDTGEAVIIHLGDSPSVDAPPPDHQGEIAAMRAMKEHLEAQAAAAGAAIEDALARARADQKEDAT